MLRASSPNGCQSLKRYRDSDTVLIWSTPVHAPPRAATRVHCVSYWPAKPRRLSWLPLFLLFFSRLKTCHIGAGADPPQRTAEDETELEARSSATMFPRLSYCRAWSPALPACKSKQPQAQLRDFPVLPERLLISQPLAARCMGATFSTPPSSSLFFPLTQDWLYPGL